tara:strand:- start:758 stop:1003 length:246 start_codon:yes stop_codon:yes gene_type:complete
MTVTFANTTPIEYPIERGRTHYISAASGDLTVERYTAAGAWLAVDGSPVVSGTEKFLVTYSNGDKIRVTPSAAGTEMVLEK